MQKLHATTELAIADISDKISATQAKNLKTNPSAYITSEYGLDSENLDINVVENSDSVMNLSLPYYTSIKAIHADALSDDDLDDVAGGEIMANWSSYHSRDEWVQDTVDQHGQAYWDNNGVSNSAPTTPAPATTPAVDSTAPNTTSSGKSK